MKTPRFTDADRFRVAYTNSGATNIAKTFARIRREQEEAKARAAADEAERGRKVSTLRKGAK